jgi:hypothetical protein
MKPSLEKFYRSTRLPSPCGTVGPHRDQPRDAGSAPDMGPADPVDAFVALSVADREAVYLAMPSIHAAITARGLDLETLLGRTGGAS